MGCCGQLRKNIAVTPAPDDDLRLEYTGSNRVRVRNPATGHEYVCSPGETGLPVRIEDARALLATGLFRTVRQPA